MDEVENKGVSEEIAAPETSQQEAPATSQPDQDKQDRNWRELRRAKDDLEKKARMQEELISQLLSVQKQAQPQAPEVDELANISADDYIPKGQVEKLVQRAEKKAERIANEAIDKRLKEMEQSQFLDRLQKKFPDFDEVVNPETIDLLEQQDPELAKNIADMGDPYKIGMQTYKFIKSMNLADKVPAARRSKEVEKKLEQNAKTIQSPQAFDKRPMAQTFQLTEAHKKELYREMMGHASRASGVPELNG